MNNMNNMNNINKDNNKSKYAIVGKKRNRLYKLSYTLYGDGNEKILFLMGYMLEGRVWNNQIDYYIKQPDKYTICVFDYCGIGNSEYSFFYLKKHLAMDIIELLEHLNWDKTHLIGLSDGSAIAYEISLLSPHLIKSLSLYSIIPSINFKLFKESGYKIFLFVPFYAYFYDIEPYQLYTRLTISDTYLNSKSKDKGKLIKDIIYPPSKKLYDSIYTKPLYIRLSYMISSILHTIKPINNYQLLNRQYPIAMYYASDDLLISKSNFNIITNNIKPNLIVHCNDSGHCIQVEDIHQFHQLNNQFFNMINLNIFNNNQNQIHQTIDLNIGLKDSNFKLPFINMNSIFILLLNKLRYKILSLFKSNNNDNK